MRVVIKLQHNGDARRASAKREHPATLCYAKLRLNSIRENLRVTQNPVLPNCCLEERCTLCEARRVRRFCRKTRAT